MSDRAFDPGLKPARQRLPQGACDCHFHIFEDVAMYPVAPTAVYEPAPATEKQYKALCKTYGIDRAVLVHPSVYGADHTSYERFLIDNADWLRGVAVVGDSTTEAQIERWHGMGTRGTRLNMLTPGALTAAASVIAKVKPKGWHVQLFVPLAEEPRLLAQVADQGVTVVVDHFGHSAPEVLLVSAGFANLISMMREGRAWVKISAPYRLSQSAPDYPEVRKLLDAYLDANPSRVVWGTDWPHPNFEGPMPNDGDLVDLVFDWLPDANLRREVLVDNPTQLYWT